MGYFKYTGQWRNGIKEGRGRLEFGDGGFYEGEFSQGEIIGRGVQRWPDGSTYEGDFHMGERHGHGTWTQPPAAADSSREASTTYTGQWKTNKREGFGELRWADGVYRGQFKAHRFDGLGALHLLNSGLQFAAAFSRGVKSGLGVCEHVSHHWRYEGQFEDDRQGPVGLLRDHKTGIHYLGVWDGGEAKRVAAKMHLEVPKVEEPAEPLDPKAKAKAKEVKKGDKAAGKQCSLRECVGCIRTLHECVQLQQVIRSPQR
ncbi:unnamed protein product [Vitrella brassicaformis CCMP3155]|uniref:MORN repeat-containing protein 5 n=1 Tax=Vitrella brassicaformis (strain CCMP3155) TaxID=1169540 RepID=A0A0G4F179_VITBC|nr:unnamed protein product [Vitrella brassicaformis CCMP3155]|eukprot:CEM05289.1 unnamed protein product [Vitrella brassicaformis CCMP3155]